MLEKISIDDLRVGMTVERVGRPWLQHPFLSSRKRIQSERDIEKLREYHIAEVYIDRGAEAAAGNDRAKGSGVTDAAVPDSSDRLDDPRDTNVVPLEEELHAARQVRSEARAVANDVLSDVRAGKTIESGKVALTVNRMIDSIFRNNDALSYLSRIKGHDEYTFVHSVNVCTLSLTLGRHLRLERDDLITLGIGAMLHDTGKMRIPLEILNKPGKLTDDEFSMVKKHPVFSAEILDATPGIPGVAVDIGLQHHERFNGRGYPQGLKDNESRFLSQITAIIDVYDAMTSDRVYAKGMSPHDGIRRISELGPRDFDPSLVERFIQCMGIYPVGTLVQMDTGEIGVVISVNRDRILRPRVLVLFREETGPLRSPLPVDLTEPGSTPDRFRRTISRPLDPSRWNLDMAQVLSMVS